MRLDFADAYGNRANMLAELGRRRGAVKLRPRGCAQSEFGADWLNRGATLHGIGRVDDAISSYDKAIALDADFR